jgi:hypothetical protein
MLPTAMAASQAKASEKKSFLQRLMIDICSSRFFCYRTATRRASVMPGKLFVRALVCCAKALLKWAVQLSFGANVYRGLQLVQLDKKRPPEKPVAGAWEMSRSSKEWAGRDTGVQLHLTR